jgi:hypothetical protein
MPMTACTVTSASKCAVTGTYPPAGVTGALANNRISQSAPADMTALTFGTTSGKVDLITCSDRTLTAGAAATYDLYTGTDLVDLGGLTCALRKVKFIQITITTGGDAAGVTVGNAAADGWAGFFGAAAHTYTIFPGGPAFGGGSPAGVAVGASAKNLKVLNNGAVSVTVRIVIAGTSV